MVNGLIPESLRTKAGEFATKAGAAATRAAGAGNSLLR